MLAKLRLIVAGAAALACLVLPASAFAGTFTWTMPANFTATGSGANPDHDSYGAAPWSYVESAPAPFLGSPSHDPTTFSPLSSFSTSVDNGLAGWSDPSDSNTLVATNPTNATITNGPASYPPDELALTPASDRFVAVGWKSPLNSAATVTVSGTINPDGASACLLLGGLSWSLDQNGSSIQSGGPSNTSISASPSVQPGGSIYLTVYYTGPYGTACDTAGVTLTVTAQVSSGPAVSVLSPAQGALISGGQPTFSGAADTTFGASPNVTVKLYSGTAASGTPLQVLTTTASGGSYAVGPSSALGDGVYTVQALEQDQASPPDTGTSTPVTFRIYNAPPTIQLGSLGSKPLLNATPTLSGVAGTSNTDLTTVKLVVYPGPTTNATPVRILTGPVAVDGGFAITVNPALPDGQYTAVVAQGTTTGGVGFSAPVTFRVKLHPPALTIVTPATGSNISQASLLFSGAAGNALGDSPTVTLTLFPSPTATGRSIGTASATRSGAGWKQQWPRKLALGLYTIRAVQKDDAGHTTTKTSTFLIIPPPSVIGANVNVTQDGTATVAISCNAVIGTKCTGDVLIVTKSLYRPAAGGPTGLLRVMFGYFNIPGGSTQVLSRKVLRPVLRVMRRGHSIRVNVTVLTRSGHARPKLFTAARLASVAR